MARPSRGVRAWSIIQEEVEAIQKRVRVNTQIRISSVRRVSEGGKQVGFVPTEEALKLGEEAGLDLVEVAPQANTQVCRYVECGTYKDVEGRKAR